MTTSQSSETVHARSGKVLLRPRKLHLRTLGDTVGERNGCSDGAVLNILSVLWDVSLEQLQRPLREFFIRPQIPIGDMYTTRLLVNLLWFSRNYHNLAFLISLAIIAFRPPCALIVFVSCIMHITKRYTSIQISKKGLSTAGAAQHGGSCRSGVMLLLTILQILCCTYVWYLCGFFLVTMLIAVVAGPIVAHAFLTPYTDDAFELYCNVLQKNNLSVPLPRSPTQQFSSVDPTFDVLNRRDSSLLSPRYGIGDDGDRILSPHSFALLRHTLREELAGKQLRPKRPEPLEQFGRHSAGCVVGGGERPSFAVSDRKEVLDPTGRRAGPLNHMSMTLSREGITLLPNAPENHVHAMLVPTNDEDQKEESPGEEESESETSAKPPWGGEEIKCVGGGEWPPIDNLLSASGALGRS